MNRRAGKKARPVFVVDGCSVERPRWQVDASGMAPQGRLALVTGGCRAVRVRGHGASGCARCALWRAQRSDPDEGAVLQGSVNANDKVTKYYFEYGTTTAYGASTPQGTLAKSKAWRPVSAQVTGLAAADRPTTTGSSPRTARARTTRAWPAQTAPSRLHPRSHPKIQATPIPEATATPRPGEDGTGTIQPWRRRDLGRRRAAPQARLERRRASPFRPRAHPGSPARQCKVRGSGCRRGGSAWKGVDASQASSRSPLHCPPGVPRPAGSAAAGSSCARISGGTSTSTSAGTPARGRTARPWRVGSRFRDGAATVCGGMTMAGGSAPTAATVRRPCAERVGL